MSRLLTIAVVVFALVAACGPPPQPAAPKSPPADPEKPSRPLASAALPQRTTAGAGTESPAPIQSPEPKSEAKTVDREPPADIDLWLPNFYRALNELALGRRAQHVRIAWYGDSHTAADFLTGEVRRQLQARFGNGGPGFVRVGVRNYRHDDVLSERFGKWAREPDSPASHELQADGVFGLAGMRSTALRSSSQAKLRLQLAARKLLRDEPLTWELIWRLSKPRAQFTVQVGSNKPIKVNYSGSVPRTDLESGLRVRASQLMGLSLQAKPGDHVRLHRTLSQPEFFGAVIETQRPGVVLDTLGINGARIRTALGWHPGNWLGELAERDPQLVVLAFGTNEVGDARPVSDYAGYFREVLVRVREVAPGADCLLIGPTQRVDSDWQPLKRATEIDQMQHQIAAELGCASYSLLSAMEAGGGFRAWVKERLASSDRIHLTAAGYRQLADGLVGELFTSFDKLYMNVGRKPSSRAKH